MNEELNNTGDIIIYQTEDGLTKINVKLNNETVWLNQQQLVMLYQSSKSNISEHIKHIFAEGELDEKSVVRKFRTTADDGKNYEVTYYNLDMIISLGYRIKSAIATTGSFIWFLMAAPPPTPLITNFSSSVDAINLPGQNPISPTSNAESTCWPITATTS